MKFAEIHGERTEALPGMSAACPVCAASVIRQFSVAHRVHRGGRVAFINSLL